MNDALRPRLEAAITRYLHILADHGFILDAECDDFIREPVHGVYALLFYAMETIDPDFARVERLQSTLGPGEDLDRLEAQLVDFITVLDALCTDYKQWTGVNPIQEMSDPTGGRVAVALMGAEIAVERLAADGAACRDGSSEQARAALEWLRAEGTSAAIERHRRARLAARS